MGPPSTVPVISLAQDEAAAAAAIRKACVEVGFFYVSDHGVPPTLVDKTLQQSRAFFSLPQEEKVKYLADSNNRGYTPMMEETLDPARQKKGDTKEGYYIGREVHSDSLEAAKPLHGPNTWPDSALLSGWRPVMEEYFAAMTDLGMRITRLIGLALGLPPGAFDSPGMFDRPMLFLRLLHYSAEPSDPAAGVFGAGAHTDYGMLTLLVTDGTPGLQICPDRDCPCPEWLDVPPIDGTYVINLGDMLERWSNGLFRSSLHRVINHGQERYSIPFFFEPNFDCRVECLPQCCTDDNPARYPPTTSGQHLLDKYRQTHANFSDQPPPSTSVDTMINGRQR